MVVKDSYKAIFGDVQRVLVVLAHPDDMEITCGGLIARLNRDGKKVRLVVTTNGGKGMQNKEGLIEKEFADKRVAEQTTAGETLGINPKENFNLQIPDGEIETGVENIEKIAFHIRQHKPDIVITHNPHDLIIDFMGQSHWVNHRDHRNTGQITLDAIYPYSRDRGFFPNHFTEHKLEPHTVTKVLMADSYTKDAVKYFAIDNFLEQKKKALTQHPSALNPDYADEYVDENKMENGYFEPLGYYEIY